MENIVCAYAKIVCKQKTIELIKSSLERMIRPLAVGILNCVKVENLDETVVKTMLNHIKILCCIFRMSEDLGKYKPDNPLIGLYSELSSVLMQAMKKFQKFEKIIEEIVQTVKHAMRSLGNYFLQYLTPFAQEVIEGFKENHFSTYLYCAEFTASVFGNNVQFHELLQMMFNILGQQTFQFLGKNGFMLYPHLVEDLFGMCLRYIKYCPELIFGSIILQELLQFAIAVIGYEHIEASKALYNFLQHFFDHFGLKDPNIALQPKESEAKGFLIINGPLISKKLILNIETAPPKILVEYLIDLIIHITDAFPEESIIWLSEAIDLVLFLHICIFRYLMTVLQAQKKWSSKKL